MNALLVAMLFSHPQGYVCLFTKSPPTFTGNLNDIPWSKADWTQDFIDIEGNSKPMPRFLTRVKMLWDEKYFYVGAELSEPHIWATLTKHDSVIFHDNDFEVFIDPNGDNHDYYEFEINALGTFWDLRLPKPYRDGGTAINEWEIPGLKSKVTIYGTLNNPLDTDEKWVVELAFPWRVLAEFAGTKSPPNPGDQWRVNFSRVQWQTAIKNNKYEKIPNLKEDNWVWSPQHAVDMHRPEFWGYVQFEKEKTQFKSDPDWQTKCELMDYFYKNKSKTFIKSQKAPSGKTWSVNNESKLWSTP